MDRVFNGMIAGVIAGIILNIYNFVCYYVLKIVRIRFIDWTNIVLHGVRPDTTREILLSLFHQLMWDGFLGIIFAFLLTKISPKGYLIKGLLYGYFLTFIFDVIAQLYRLPLIGVAKRSNPANIIGTMLWGLTMSYVLKKLEEFQVKS